MPRTTRQFTDQPAVRSQTPLLLGIAGPSGSGKTFSAFRLATGMQSVLGGDIWGIDTEARRMLHYSDKFKFRHIDFRPPFGPLDYLEAFRHAADRGAKLIIADSMTHEHNGPGGVLDQIEDYLDRKAGPDADEGQRMKYFASANKEPKRQRKELNNAIVQMGINAIFCYRANDVSKPEPGKGFKHIGWTPETTSKLTYEMVQMFLLPPGSQGRPVFAPETAAEKLMVKTPDQFKDWFREGLQLDEALGRKMAEWSLGSAAPVPAAGSTAGSAAPGRPAPLPAAWEEWGLEERGLNRANAGLEAFRAFWKTLGPEDRAKAESKLPEWRTIAEKKP